MGPIPVGRGSAPPASAAVLPIEGLHHYTVSVADLEESAGWYGRVFGFNLVYQNQRHPWGRVAYMQAPGFLLELIEAREPRPVPAYAAGPEPDADLTVCGHKHMALMMSGGVVEAVDELRGLGVDVVSFKTVSFEGTVEFKAAFLLDATGALMEIPEDNARTSLEVGACVKASTVKGLHHVAVCVPDREQAVQWYSHIFGDLYT